MKLFLILPLLLCFLACEEMPQGSNEDIDLQSKSAQTIIEANNAFAFDLIKAHHTNATSRNYMLSPLSVSLALGMAYNGAEGDTRKAFETTMYYHNLPLDVNAFNQQLMARLASADEGSVLEIASAIWGNASFPFKSSFFDINRNYYAAEVQNLNFLDPTTLDRINDWVNEKTHGKIPSIINEIQPDDVLYLINALYFNASWKYAFDEEETRQGDFRLANGELIKVDKMFLTQGLLYQTNTLFSSVVLPYEKDKFSMTVLLPQDSCSLDDIIDSLTIENWYVWKDKYDSTQDVTLSLPKFKYEYKKKLNDELIDLGLELAFDPFHADFSSISDVSTFISKVLQKTFIDVKEEGTEAAAVTFVGVGTTSIGEEPMPLYFDVNRPFLYLITDNATGTICFMGKVAYPQYEE